LRGGKKGFVGNEKGRSLKVKGKQKDKAQSHLKRLTVTFLQRDQRLKVYSLNQEGKGII